MVEKIPDVSPDQPLPDNFAFTNANGEELWEPGPPYKVGLTRTYPDGSCTFEWYEHPRTLSKAAVEAANARIVANGGQPLYVHEADIHIVIPPRESFSIFGALQNVWRKVRS